MKVLLVRTDSQLGDSIFETCFYRELKRCYPSSYVTVMACGNRCVLENLPYIDEFIWLPGRGIGRFLRAFAALPYLWKQHYDVLVSLTPTWRMKLFNRLLPGKRKFPFEYRLGRPAVQAYVDILEQLGCREVDSSYTLIIPPRAAQEAATFLGPLAATPFLLVNPVASEEEYTLSPQDTRRIIQRLRQAGLDAPIVLLDYKNQYALAEGENVQRFTGNDVLAVAAIVARSAYVLTVDTAISHMAATFKRPMTVLFTDQPRRALARVKALEHVASFAPRTANTCVLWAKHSVRAIDPAEIVRSVLCAWQKGA